jgi:hypothetical protein
MQNNKIDHGNSIFNKLILSAVVYDKLILLPRFDSTRNRFIRREAAVGPKTKYSQYFTGVSAQTQAFCSVFRDPQFNPPRMTA